MPSAEAFGAEDAVGSEVKARSEWTGCVCHGAEAFTPGQEESDLAGVVWRGVVWRGVGFRKGAGLPERGGASGKAMRGTGAEQVQRHLGCRVFRKVSPTTDRKSVPETGSPPRRRPAVAGQRGALRAWGQTCVVGGMWGKFCGSCRFTDVSFLKL